MEEEERMEERKQEADGIAVGFWRQGLLFLKELAAAGGATAPGADGGAGTGSGVLPPSRHPLSHREGGENLLETHVQEEIGLFRAAEKTCVGGRWGKEAQS